MGQLEWVSLVEERYVEAPSWIGLVGQVDQTGSSREEKGARNLKRKVDTS